MFRTIPQHRSRCGIGPVESLQRDIRRIGRFISGGRKLVVKRLMASLAGTDRIVRRVLGFRYPLGVCHVTLDFDSHLDERTRHEHDSTYGRY